MESSVGGWTGRVGVRYCPRHRDSRSSHLSGQPELTANWAHFPEKLTI
jgi:hypothetical protein